MYVLYAWYASCMCSMKDIFLFQHLSKKQMGDVVRVMSREQVVKGDKVIKQGDQGDRFYIVDTGEYDVSL